MFKWGLKLKLLKQIRYNPRGNIYSIACQNNDYKGIEVKIIKSENDPQIYAYTRHFSQESSSLPSIPAKPECSEFLDLQCFLLFLETIFMYFKRPFIQRHSVVRPLYYNYLIFISTPFIHISHHFYAFTHFTNFSHTKFARGIFSYP